MNALHTALWSSYADVPTQSREPGAPLTVGRLLPALHAGAKQAPRPLLALAMANLLGRDLGTRSVPGDLDTLVMQVLGSSVVDLRAAHRANSQPLLVLAELYGILDYRWKRLPPTKHGTAGARMELCVQRPFEEVRSVLDPENWFHTCGVFWNAPKTNRATGRAPSRRKKTTLAGQLTLPGGQSGSAIAVTINVTATSDALCAVKRFDISGEQIEVCHGVLKAEKEPGRPGATRVTHEKRVRFAPGPLSDFGEETLAYWIQAETLCLLLPP